MAKKATPTPRCVRVTGRENSTTYIRIKTDYSTSEYAVTPIPSDFGDAFRVAKIEGDEEIISYDVALSDEGHLCDCIGWSKNGTCRHVECLAVLRQRGKI